MAASFETPEFRAAFMELLAWRRDVRSFRPQPLPDGLIAELIAAATLAPSVGLSQAWRFVRIASPAAREGVREIFRRCNAEALAGYDGEDAALYARLKLAGLDQAPEQIAVFSDPTTARGKGLGRRTMPQSLDHSVVTAVHTLWLLARIHGVGVGWVSILEPAQVTGVLDVPQGWSLIAYLCLGFPSEVGRTPELERLGWETRAHDRGVVLTR